MDRWVTAGQAPPPSCHPRLDDGTAVLQRTPPPRSRRCQRCSFPAHLRGIARLDFGAEIAAGLATILPPKGASPMPTWWPQSTRRQRMLVSVCRISVCPLATYTGWNVRHADIGRPGRPCHCLAPLCPSRRHGPSARPGDPRLSTERYVSKEEALRRVQQAAEVLVQQEYCWSRIRRRS